MKEKRKGGEGNQGGKVEQSWQFLLTSSGGYSNIGMSSSKGTHLIDEPKW